MPAHNAAPPSYGAHVASRAQRPFARALWGVLLGATAFVVPTILAIYLTADTQVIGPRTVRDLLGYFARYNYDLTAVAAGRDNAPRLFLEDLPKDWRGIAQADERKRAFVMVVLPLVLRENERLLEVRARLLDIEKKMAAGGTLPAGERRWLDRLAASYRLKTADIKTLKARVDVVPPSLAIAQAAIESGWGASRFAAAGNALYGQWTEQGANALVPAERDPGRTYAIRRFASLADSVASYMKNLNTHAAYRAFRALRADLRARGETLDGAALAVRLKSYSAQGLDYVEAIQAIIDKNGLGELDRARLRSQG